MINHETIYYEIYSCPMKRTTCKNDYIFLMALHFILQLCRIVRWQFIKLLIGL